MWALATGLRPGQMTPGPAAIPPPPKRATPRHRTRIPSGWGCTLEPGGGPFSNVHLDGCRWKWKCPDAGDRELFCETISTAEHTCDCKNLTDQTVEKTFRRVDICTYDAQSIAAQANQLCGWQL